LAALGVTRWRVCPFRRAWVFPFAAGVVVIANHAARNVCQRDDLLWVRGPLFSPNKPVAVGSSLQRLCLLRSQLCALFLPAWTNSPALLYGSDLNRVRCRTPAHRCRR